MTNSETITITPHAVPDAERALLHDMVTTNEGIKVAAQYVTDPSQFYTEAHGAIYKSILDLYAVGGGVDWPLIREDLRAKGVLPIVEPALRGVIDTETGGDTGTYASMVQDSYHIRKLLVLLGDYMAELQYINLASNVQGLENTIEQIASDLKDLHAESRKVYDA